MALRRWTIALVAGLLGLATHALPVSAQTVDRSATVEGTAHWSDGTGDCNTGNRNAHTPTGVADAFDTGASVSHVEGTITVHWRIATGGPFMGPITGLVAADRTFDLRGRASNGETWTFTGTLTDRQMVGTFVRRADYGGPCTAEWKLAIDLERPLFAGDLATESTASSPTEGAGGDAEDATNGGLDWLPVGVGGVGLLALLAWLVRWLKQRQEHPGPSQHPEWQPTQPIGTGSAPVGSPGGTSHGPAPDPTGPLMPDEPPVGESVVHAADPCTCTCTLTIEGPERLYVCDCAQPTWRLRPISGLPDDVRALEAVVAEGAKCPRNHSANGDDNVLFGRALQANTSPTCSHGGEVGVIRLTWSVDASSATDGEHRSLSVRVTATAPVKCPTGTHEMRCEAIKVVSLRPAKCQVYVVINKHPTVPETGHAAVRIVCGEFDRIYGYFPTYEGVSTLVPHAGKVKVKRSDSPQQEFDSIDDHYPEATKWSFEVPCTCEQCAEVQAYWERLRANPGRYGLVNNNCTTQALESVKALLPPFPSDAGVLDKVPVISPQWAVFQLDTLGLKKFITPPKIK